MTGERGRVGLVEDFEAHAIEAHHTRAGGEPKIAVARLPDALEPVMRQSVLRRPGIEMVLRACRAAEQTQPEQTATPSPAQPLYLIRAHWSESSGNFWGD